jgi:hypothetical protein
MRSTIRRCGVSVFVTPMKSKLPLFLAGALMAMVPLVEVARGEGPASQPVPRFEGYLAMGDDTRFQLALLGPDGKPASQSWLKIGQTFGGFEIASFDAKTEILKLKKPGGSEVEIGLIDGKTVESENSSIASREEARRYAMDRVALFLKSIREEQPERRVTVNPDVALMSDDQRKRFLERRERFVSNGQFLTPFLLPDGRWGEAISGDEAMKLPLRARENLSDEDRREINLAWAMARAEAIARGIPPKAPK